MSAAALLRSEFRLVHALLEITVGTDPAPYAAMTVCEDVTINSVLRRGIPLALSSYRSRTGLSELPLLAQPDERPNWSRRVHIERAAFSAYAHAVHSTTDAYLGDLADEPPDNITRVLVALLLRLFMLRGEISALRVGARSRLEHEHHYQRGEAPLVDQVPH